MNRDTKKNATIDSQLRKFFIFILYVIHRDIS